MTSDFNPQAIVCYRIIESQLEIAATAGMNARNSEEVENNTFLNLWLVFWKAGPSAVSGVIRWTMKGWTGAPVDGGKYGL
jgi:hypothetical protein